MKGQFLRNYKNEKGTTVFVYAVSGTDEELETFGAIQGTKLRNDKDTGKPLWFTIRYVADNVALNFNKDETSVYADTSELDKAQSIAEQYGANFGEILVKQMLGAKAAQAAPVQTPAPAESNDDLSGM